MHQPQRNVHALAGGELELLEHFGFGRFLDPDLKPASAQVERLGLELMEMQRAALTLANLENLAAVQIAIYDPYLAPPSLGHDVDWSACAVHSCFTVPFIERDAPRKRYVHPAKLHSPVYHDSHSAPIGTLTRKAPALG